jgi:hypothetical protein
MPRLFYCRLLRTGVLIIAEGRGIVKERAAGVLKELSERLRRPE